MRSKLFVPASRPELFTKARASAADAISFDLEDAVVEARKGQARAALADWLGTLDEQADQPTHQKIIVRVNAMDTPHFAKDLEAVIQQGLTIVNLPKPQSVDAVREAASLMAALEKKNGITKPIQLLLNIETPNALRSAAALAKADTRVMGLQVGLGDLFEPLGIDRQDVAAVHSVLFAVRMAAGEAGVMAFDGAFANVADSAGYKHEAQMAKSLGFTGKSCIHPSQIALANEVFYPSALAIEHAKAVVEAAKTATAQGVGAFMVNGQMIDAPFLRRAEAIVAIENGAR